ncbi:MAG: tRNA glutamyl-Q(34) synthetase GluQRS [Methylococcales bacterium]|nr:tRNA glutamyl-Q(34) synthetase GluQRS [Methylococcales bacterium]
MLTPHYTGRFAPSPTGHLHLGSVYTALASFLEARSHHSLWRLRFDDLDTPRNVAGATTHILQTLETLGLHWDGEVDYQSWHLDDYHAVLADFITSGKIYRCQCSRKNLTDIYAQTCRYQCISPDLPHSLRIKTDDQQIIFDDILQGWISQNLATQHGDFILKRKDNIIAYPFAVVLDDARQAVNHVVRGMDLLNATPKQLYLQHLLHLPAPNYLHVPILVDAKGHKLSKQTLATAVDLTAPNRVLFQLLDWLKQMPPFELQNENVGNVLEWAIQHWNVARLKGVKHIAI